MTRLWPWPGRLSGMLGHGRGIAAAWAPGAGPAGGAVPIEDGGAVVTAAENGIEFALAVAREDNRAAACGEHPTEVVRLGDGGDEAAIGIHCGEAAIYWVRGAAETGPRWAGLARIAQCAPVELPASVEHDQDPVEMARRLRRASDLAGASLLGLGPRLEIYVTISLRDDTPHIHGVHASIAGAVRGFRPVERRPHPGKAGASGAGGGAGTWEAVDDGLWQAWMDDGPGHPPVVTQVQRCRLYH